MDGTGKRWLAGAAANRRFEDERDEHSVGGIDAQRAGGAGAGGYDRLRCRAVGGIAIPTLCHLQSQTPVGVCLYVVDTGARVLSASCVRPVEAGMKVSTSSEKVLAARKTLLELLMADHLSPCAATTFRGLRAGNVGEDEQNRHDAVWRRRQHREERTILRWPSPSTTTRAFCATGASAGATRSKAILYWGEWAKGIPQGLRLI